MAVLNNFKVNEHGPEKRIAKSELARLGGKGSSIMEMKRINAGKLRAIGYDARNRRLRVEFENGTAIDYSGVGSDIWQRFSTSGSAWSFYRDNIEEEFSGRQSTVVKSSGVSPQLKDLFKPTYGDAED